MRAAGEEYNEGQGYLVGARSCAVRTERTILSPFTKEYRVCAANSSIRLFLEGAFPIFREGPTVVNIKLFLFTKFALFESNCLVRKLV